MIPADGINCWGESIKSKFKEWAMFSTSEGPEVVQGFGNYSSGFSLLDVALTTWKWGFKQRLELSWWHKKTSRAPVQCWSTWQCSGAGEGTKPSLRTARIFSGKIWELGKLYSFLEFQQQHRLGMVSSARSICWGRFQELLWAAWPCRSSEPLV